jgi:hypothetical protein
MLDVTGSGGNLLTRWRQMVVSFVRFNYSKLSRFITVHLEKNKVPHTVNKSSGLYCSTN